MPIRAPEPDTVIRGTTILCVRNAGHVVVAGDGQVSVGQTIMKHGARKVRRLHDDKVLSGFAGSTADALTLFEKFEGKLQELQRQPAPRGGRDGQGLAHRPRAAAAGGDADRGRPRKLAS